jgi:hypothetical protein
MSPKEKTSAAGTVPGQGDLIAASRWGWYLLSLLVPFAGIFIGLLLYDQESREVRKVGRTCLLIGFLVWVLFPVLVLMTLVLFGTLAVFSWISQAMPSAD